MRAQLRERLLILDADDQVAAMLSMRNSLKQLEARVAEMQLKLDSMPRSRSRPAAPLLPLRLPWHPSRSAAAQAEPPVVAKATPPIVEPPKVEPPKVEPPVAAKVEPPPPRRPAPVAVEAPKIEPPKIEAAEDRAAGRERRARSCESRGRPGPHRRSRRGREHAPSHACRRATRDCPRGSGPWPVRWCSSRC
jgi:hypothetical protein